MNLPQPIQVQGPAQLQELQIKFNQLLEYCKSLKMQSSPTVKTWHTAVGQFAEAAAPVTNETTESGDPRWS